MPHAVPFDLRSTARSPRLPAPNGLEAKFDQPVANRRGAPIQPLSDLAQGQSFIYQGLQFRLTDATFRRVPPRAIRLEPVLLQPIADRRRMLSGPFAYRIERKLLRQAVFEEALLHSTIIANLADRTFRAALTR